MIGYIAGCLKGAMSLVKGLSVTFRTMLRPTVTVLYPYQKTTLAERYRGIMGLPAKAEEDLKKQEEEGVEEENGHLSCISCLKCEEVCPVACISIQREKAKKGFALKAFSINFARCTFCGLCVDACPVKGKAIVHSRHYEEVFLRRKDMVFDVRMLDLVGQGKRPHEPLRTDQIELLRGIREQSEAFSLSDEENAILKRAIRDGYLRRVVPEEFELVKKIAEEGQKNSKLTEQQQAQLMEVLETKGFELSTFAREEPGES